MKTKKLFPVILVVIGLVIGFSVSYFGNFTRDRAGGIVAPKVLFTVDGVDYAESNLSEKMRLELYQLRNESYNREAYALKAYALRLLLAKQNNVPMISDEPPGLDKLLPLPKISDQDIDAFYKMANTELPKDAKKEELYSKIKMGLTFNKYTETYRDNLQKNKRSKKLEFYFSQPTLPDTEFTQFEKHPVVGDLLSKDELIVMSPFFCKSCLKIHNSVKMALAKTPIKARIIYTYDKKESPDYVWSHAIYCLNQESESAFKEFYNRYNYNFAVNENPLIKLQQILKDQVINWSGVTDCLGNDTAFYRESQLSSLGVSGANVIFFNGKALDLEDDLSDVLAEKIKK